MQYLTLATVLFTIFSSLVAVGGTPIGDDSYHDEHQKSCSPQEFYYHERDCCLPRGGPVGHYDYHKAKYCPHDYYWHHDEKCCVPKHEKYVKPWCPEGYTWKEGYCHESEDFIVDKRGDESNDDQWDGDYKADEWDGKDDGNEWQENDFSDKWDSEDGKYDDADGNKSEDKYDDANQNKLDHKLDGADKGKFEDKFDGAEKDKGEGKFDGAEKNKSEGKFDDGMDKKYGSGESNHKWSDADGTKAENGDKKEGNKEEDCKDCKKQ